MIDRVALEAANVDGRIDHIAAAARLAGMLADIGARRRHGVILADEAHGVRIASFAHERDIARNVNAGRTKRHTGHGILQRSKAAVVLHMVHIIVTEALKAAQDELRCVTADRTVRRGNDRARRSFDGVNGHHCAGSVQNLSHQRGKLAKADPARHTFAARLRVAELQERQRHVNGAQSGRAGRDSAFHVLVQPVNDCLRPAGSFNIQSAQGFLTPSVLRSRCPYGESIFFTLLQYHLS